jgi:predicted lipid-binding transport protein (Tim44 family)
VSESLLKKDGFMKRLICILSLAILLATPQAYAKRLGGGRSVGQQSSNVTQRQAPAQQQPAVHPQGVHQAAPAFGQVPAKPAAPVGAAAPAKKPWGAMLGGIAAGLGLAWLASSLGMGGAMGNLGMMLIVGLGLFLILGWFAVRRQKASPGLVGAGASGESPMLRPYSAHNVGNDASARPWEAVPSQFGPASTPAPAAGGSMIGSALAGSQSWGVPAEFDVDGFLKASKTNFINLQAAWDRSDIAALKLMMTDDMLAEIKQQLADREQQSPGQPNVTEVAMLEAQLLGIEDMPAQYMASVEFSGMMRESPSSGMNPFREVWNITRPKSGSGGWLVAGVQSMQ